MTALDEALDLTRQYGMQSFVLRIRRAGGTFNREGPLVAFNTMTVAELERLFDGGERE
ncbi:hypothetical protein MM326_13940 [Alkalihalobacillus sp. LMS6]|jgi:hypothetical protein|uniref:hypothetical protein n=1 Tax=Alkalihalobacillus sp. LMS6 TaxID=2924034 RepID=UPI0020D09E82|nr:hypothetical protein [Alkalihalobacillus sp. LMS6]UTR05204.1 hypothetical protein MM326_13940 [Alkalihalobacillus sp. LMS6]